MLYLYNLLRKRLFVAVVAVAYVIALTPNTTLAGGFDDPTLEDIITAWQARQDAIRSARFEWTASVVTPRGSRTPDLWVFAHDSSGGITLPEESEIHPPEDAVHERSSTLLLDGTMLRHSWDGFAWSPGPKSPGFQPHSVIDASDGHTSKSITNRMYGPLTQEVYPGGVILERPENLIEHGNYHTNVLLYYLRPLDPSMGCLSDNWHHQADRTAEPKVSFETREGIRYAVIRQEFGPVRPEIWVDPERAYTIRRVVVFFENDSQPMTQVTVSYRPDDHVGWVPHSWRGDHWLNGLRESYTAQMKSYDINPEIDIVEFRPEFPAGSYVGDHRDRSSFFVRDDGSRRDITAEELRRGATYSQIARTDSGEAGLVIERRSLSVRWLTLISVVLVVALVCVVILRLRAVSAENQ